MTLYIKNMVCPRCISAVGNLLGEMGIPFKEIRLGEVETISDLSTAQIAELSSRLLDLGFERLDDPRSRMVEQVRLAVLEWVRMEGERPRMSDFVGKAVGKDYSSLSKLFSEMHGMTVERFAILHRIEYSKELICYSEQTTGEIAYRLGYSSPAHFSAQFKQVTGMTPKAFREQRQKSRKSLADI